MEPELSQTQVESREAYLLHVLKSGSKCKTMNELSVHQYFHSKNTDRSKLPPTSHATLAHIRRALYVKYRMRSLLHVGGRILDPRHCGYSECDGLLVPDKAPYPIPEYLIICCTCDSCATFLCACLRDGIPCCPFCGYAKMGKTCLNTI